MPNEAFTASQTQAEEAKYLAAIEESLQEMAQRRKKMKETDAVIRKLRAANRRQMIEIRTILRRVQAAI
jgi:hypothetical protein